MQHVKVSTVFALLLLVLSGCEESFIERQARMAPAEGSVANSTQERTGGYAPNPGGFSHPYPTITSQTFIPSNSMFAHTKCLTWRIEWPNYPAGTDPNKIPTVFTLTNGALNSFDYLNSIAASNTYKTHFTLYHNAQLEMSKNLWSELTYSFNGGDQMETVWFNQVYYSVKTIENIVKERPSLFETYWVDNNQPPPAYQEGDVFLFRLINQNRYGGIRIVSMTPRIIEVYLAVPNE